MRQLLIEHAQQVAAAMYALGVILTLLTAILILGMVRDIRDSMR